MTDLPDAVHQSPADLPTTPTSTAAETVGAETRRPGTPPEHASTTAPLLPPLLPWWPALRQPAAPAALLACAVAGLAAAVALPWNGPGLGWFLVALVVAAAVSAVARRSPDSGSGHRLERVAWAGGAVALMAVGMVRASEWLFALCLLAACLSGSLAVAGGRTVRSILFGAIAVPAAALRCPPWLARGVAAHARTGGGGVRLVGSTLAGVVLLTVFGSLFAGADAAFARMLSAVLPAVGGTSAFQSVVGFGVVGLGTAGACYLLAATVTLNRPSGPRAALRRAEWALPVGSLVVLFALFVLVQLVALFGGDGYVLRTSGLTYAQYARSGFWQLLVVTVLTLGVIAAAVRWAPTATAADRGWLRGLLGALAGLTLVIVASALSRMWAYQQAYGFTVLRLLVETCELWLGVVYLLVVAAGTRLRGSWLPSTIVATGVAAVLALAVLNPDRFVAQRDVDRWQRTGHIDAGYLSGLSADAARPLSRLPEPLRSCALSELARRLDRHGDGWRAWNASRSAARRTLATVPTGSSNGCAP